MKIIIILLLLFPVISSAQRDPEVTVSFSNNHSAYPFSAFKKLFTGPLHPGMAVGCRFNWSNQKQHDWFQSVEGGYFYHQFIQHAIMLSTQAGYRYKFNEHWRFSGSGGLGYLHSVPATAVLKLNDNGDYERDNLSTRPQVTFGLALASQYCFNLGEKRNAVFLEYRQTIQAPFVKSYVPLLPYNNILVGVSFFLNQKPKS